jgi:hypothetical protein
MTFGLNSDVCAIQLVMLRESPHTRVLWIVVHVKRAVTTVTPLPLWDEVRPHYAQPTTCATMRLHRLLFTVQRPTRGENGRVIKLALDFTDRRRIPLVENAAKRFGRRHAEPFSLSVGRNLGCFCECASPAHRFALAGCRHSRFLIEDIMFHGT